MDAKHLRTFLTVAREGSLTRAAQSLHLTQPALSLQLKALQVTIGVPLFNRTPHGLVLNDEGRAALPAAQRVLEALEAFERQAGTLGQALRGSLRIGTILSPEFIRLGTTLQHLVTRHPHVRTVLSQGMSGSVERLVCNGGLDAGFHIGPFTHRPGRAPQRVQRHVQRRSHTHTQPQPQSQPHAHAQTLKQSHTPLQIEPLAVFAYNVIAPKGWATRVQGLGWSEIATLPWIWTPPDSAHSRLLQRKFDALGVQAHTVAEVDQESSMLDLVRSGVGLSLARDAVALRESQANGLVLVKGLSLRCELSFIAQQARHDDPIVRAAFDAVRQAFA